MYCTQCGKNIADGSRFCIFCGAEFAQPGQTAAQEHSAFEQPSAGQAGEQPRATYSPGAMPDEPSPVAGHSNWAAWVLAVLPVVFTVAMMILIPVSMPLALLVWALTICANAALYVSDMKQFPERAMSGWGWLAIVLPVVYLYIRAAKLDKQYGPAILRTALIVACFFALCAWGMVLLVTGAMEWFRSWDGSLPFGFELPREFHFGF